MIYCDDRTIFLKSINTYDVFRYYKYIYKQIDEVIKQVGKENMV